MALSTSPTLCATAPGLSVACSSTSTMSFVLSLACGPSSHSITRAASPFFAAPIWSATTATASSELHDLAHALDHLGRRIVHALQATAEDGRLCEGRDLHARRSNIDTIDGRPV